jgi:peptidoglycan/xylan/chitin deacetylase (PgdA/CDA1 family)
MEGGMRRIDAAHRLWCVVLVVAALVALVVNGTGGSAFGAGAGVAFSVDQIPGSGFGPADRVVALTFDDGPDPTFTPQVLAVLARYQVVATFFEIGWEVAARPDLTREVAAAGHSVQNHTWDHPDLTRVPASAWPAEVDNTTGLIRSVTGLTVSCLRPPYGAFNPSVVALAGQRDLTTVLWTGDAQDWKRPGVGAIVANALAGLRNGSIIGMHDGGGDRSQTVAALPTIIQTIQARGFRLVPICGRTGRTPGPFTQRVFNFGMAPAVGQPLTSATSVVGGMSTPDSRGLWTVAADGGIFTFGDAGFFGSAGGMRLNQPVVGMAATPSGRGYWLVAADGGIFTFGDAGFFGSGGGMRLNQPVVGMAATPDGRGYWLVASDGGIFAFGDAPFHGSMGAVRLNQPVVGMAADRVAGGYWLVASDGGIFTFGDAGFYGSTGAVRLNQPVVGMAATPCGRGYWLVASDGGIFTFGDAGFFGSRAGADPNDNYAAVAPAGGSGYWVIGERPVA